MLPFFVFVFSWEVRPIHSALAHRHLPLRRCGFDCIHRPSPRRLLDRACALWKGRGAVRSRRVVSSRRSHTLLSQLVARLILLRIRLRLLELPQCLRIAVVHLLLHFAPRSAPCAISQLSASPVAVCVESEGYCSYRHPRLPFCFTVSGTSGDNSSLVRLRGFKEHTYTRTYAYIQ